MFEKSGIKKVDYVPQKTTAADSGGLEEEDFYSQNDEVELASPK